MNQQSIPVYLNLIQQLLNCPQGEEWALFQQHQELLNPELLQVMEQVASELTAEGNAQAAKFLRHWETQLAQVLSRSTHSPSTPPAHGTPDRGQAYLQLIQALLECPKGSEAEVLAANRALVDPGLVQMMHQVAAQMAAQGDRETASFLENLVAKLSHGLEQVSPFPPHAESDRPGAAKLSPEELLQQIEQVNAQRSPAAVHLPQAKLGDRFASIPSPYFPEPSLGERVQPQEPIISELPIPPTPDLPAPTQPDRSVTTSPSVPEPVASVPSPAHVSSANLEDRLLSITESLTKLVDTLTARINSPNPLWYLDILERAHTLNWILTTEEVEQLIGVKPHCSAGQDFYQRGGWIFTKVGKTGLQTAWRVTKEHSGE